MVGLRGGASSRNFGWGIRNWNFEEEVSLLVLPQEEGIARRFTRYRETSFRQSRKTHEITILSSNVHKWREDERNTRLRRDKERNVLSFSSPLNRRR